MSIQDVFSRVYISRVTIDYIHCAASFPGIKRFSENPSLFVGAPMMFPVILGNQSKMEILYQEKGACQEMSSSATTAAKREVYASGLLLRSSALLRRATSALEHPHAPRIERRRHD